MWVSDAPKEHTHTQTHILTDTDTYTKRKKSLREKYSSKLKN